MPDRNELGRRIKKVREAKHLTLKNIEAQAAISATHISEIERGKTSPTLGALIRIAKALDTDPAYFVEERDLADVSVVTLENRVDEPLPEQVGTIERLTSSIPGGRLQAGIVTLDAGREGQWAPAPHRGSAAVRVISGHVELRHGEEQYELADGDSAMLDASVLHHYRNLSPSAPAVLMWIASERVIG